MEADETAVEQLPVMVTPKWGQHPHPPIAAGDAVGLLRFGPAFQRRWSPYLACFEAGFRADYLDVHQLLLEHGW